MWIVATLLLLLFLLAITCFIMIGVKPRVRRPEMTETARMEILALQERLMRHVRILGQEIGERHLQRPEALAKAAEYLRKVWEGQGFQVHEEPVEIETQEPSQARQPCLNLFVEQKGDSAPDEIILVGAHYDSVSGSPGANDNGTGIAALLEISRSLRDRESPRTLRFVAFVNEEPPYYFSEAMGSRVHARKARQRKEKIVAMLSLETLGWYSSDRKSQRYPFPFGLFYPETGSFLAVVGNIPSRRLVVDFLRSFMEESDFPVEGIAAFESVPGISWSDHWSFWREGYPAIMLTDTAPFRYPEYHTPRDLPERINQREYARAAYGIIQAVRRLAPGR